jgi:hypothetical protein
VTPSRDCAFAGMETEPNDPPLPLDPPGPARYRGTCACGHAEQWTTQKDWAWDEIADHLMPLIIAGPVPSQAIVWWLFAGGSWTGWAVRWSALSPARI